MVIFWYATLFFFLFFFILRRRRRRQNHRLSCLCSNCWRCAETPYIVIVGFSFIVLLCYAIVWHWHLHTHHGWAIKFEIYSHLCRLCVRVIVPLPRRSLAGSSLNIFRIYSYSNRTQSPLTALHVCFVLLNIYFDLINSHAV